MDCFGLGFIRRQPAERRRVILFFSFFYSIHLKIKTLSADGKLDRTKLLFFLVLEKIYRPNTGLIHQDYEAPNISYPRQHGLIWRGRKTRIGSRMESRRKFDLLPSLFCWCFFFFCGSDGSQALAPPSHSLHPSPAQQVSHGGQRLKCLRDGVVMLVWRGLTPSEDLTGALLLFFF